MNKHQKKISVSLTSSILPVLAILLAAATLTMVTNINNESQQAFAQDMTKAEGGEGIPFAIQKTAQSIPDILAPGHEQYHQVAIALPERQDSKVYTGTVTFTASQPLQVIVVQPFNQTVAQNTTGVPVGAAETENAVALLHNEEGAFFANDIFAGSGLYFHSRSSQPFTISYTIVGKIVDLMPLPTQ